VFVSGQIAGRPGGGPSEIIGTTMAEQTRQCLRNVVTILKAAGSSLDRVVKVTVLLARPELHREMNEAYAEFFPGAKPARAMARFGAEHPGRAGRHRGDRGGIGRSAIGKLDRLRERVGRRSW
jgi:2-iminobutanoate/2-iminopropanoate deaminase